MAKATVKVTVDLELSNGTIVNLAEGDIIDDVTYRENGETKVLDGAVRVIECVTRTVPRTEDDKCHHEPYMDKYVTAKSIVVDSSEKYDMEIKEIPVSAIIGIGSVDKTGGAITVGPGPQFKPLTDIIKEAPAGAVVKLTAGTYDVPMTLDKDIAIVSDGDAKLTGVINIKKAADGTAPVVNLEGVTLTGDAVVQLDGAKTFIMKGCKVGGFNPEKSTQPIHFLNSSPDPVLVVIEDNEFLPSNENCYNLINIYGKFMDGSSISNNIFRQGCSQHNLISFFAVDDGATVYFNDNQCEYVKDMAMVHVQIPGSPKCTVIMEGNSYVSHPDTDPKWEGLFVVQPFSTQTVDYKDVTIQCNNTTKPEGQIGCRYAHANNTQLADDQWATVLVDGVKTTLPLYN